MLPPQHCSSTAHTLQLTHKPEHRRRAPVCAAHPACSLNQLLCRYYIEPHGTITSLGRNGHILATPQGSEQQRSWVTVSTTEAHPLVTPPHRAPCANSRAALTLLPSQPSAPRTKATPVRAQKPESPGAQHLGSAVCLGLSPEWKTQRRQMWPHPLG